MWESLWQRILEALDQEEKDQQPIPSLGEAQRQAQDKGFVSPVAVPTAPPSTMTVNGVPVGGGAPQAQAAPPTQDNIQTNQQVDAGQLPPEQRENIPQPEFVFDASPYGKQIPQPPKPIADLLREIMPDDATRSAIVALTESGYNPQAMNVNRNESTDVGLTQINSDTFADYQRRMPGRLEEKGIQDYQEMYDPRKNIEMMKIIQEYQGWPAWYGPPAQGYRL